MDINLARTFLEIVACHSFVQAAERLHVTQTAVSARVKTLEDLLGRQLFVRNKAGASLTPAGEQFVRHAMTLVQVWERARQQMAVPPDRRALVTVGCEISLWQPLLLRLAAVDAHAGAGPGAAHRGRRGRGPARTRGARHAGHRRSPTRRASARACASSC